MPASEFLLPNHVTYDCGISRKVKEGERNIDVATLQQIVMVEYGLLRPILTKVSWMKHTAQGQCTIKNDRLDFCMCKLNKREDLAIENPYVFSIHVSQVFIMVDSRNPTQSIVLSHKP